MAQRLTPWRGETEEGNATPAQSEIHGSTAKEASSLLSSPLLSPFHLWHYLCKSCLKFTADRPVCRLRMRSGCVRRCRTNRHSYHPSIHPRTTPVSFPPTPSPPPPIPSPPHPTAAIRYIHSAFHDHWFLRSQNQPLLLCTVAQSRIYETGLWCHVTPSTAMTADILFYILQPRPPCSFDWITQFFVISVLFNYPFNIRAFYLI